MLMCSIFLLSSILVISATRTPLGEEQLVVPSDRGSSATVHAQYGYDFFVSIPADFLDSRNRIHPGIMRFDFSDSLEPQRDMFTYDDSNIVYRAVSFGNGLVRIQINDQQRFSSERMNPLMFWQLGPMSPLMTPNSINRPRGYIIAPVSDSIAHFVINPENPNDYAFEGEIFYAPQNAPDIPFWTIPFAVRLLYPNQDGSIPLLHSDYTFCILYDAALRGRNLAPVPRYFVVPSRILQGINGLLSDRGVSMSAQSGPILRGFDESMYDILPSIQYIMETDDDQSINLIVMEPRQYIQQFNSNHYLFLLRATHPLNEECILTAPILKKLVIHFDTANRRIGFGEPLMEI